MTSVFSVNHRNNINNNENNSNMSGACRPISHPQPPIMQPVPCSRQNPNSPQNNHPESTFKHWLEKIISYGHRRSSSPSSPASIVSEDEDPFAKAFGRVSRSVSSGSTHRRTPSYAVLEDKYCIKSHKCIGEGATAIIRTCGKIGDPSKVYAVKVCLLLPFMSVFTYTLFTGV
jgi:hypothetical protein